MNKHHCLLLALLRGRGLRRSADRRGRHADEHADEAERGPAPRPAARGRRLRARARDLRGRRAARIPRLGYAGRRSRSSPRDVAADRRARAARAAASTASHSRRRATTCAATETVHEPHSFDVTVVARHCRARASLRLRVVRRPHHDRGRGRTRRRHRHGGRRARHDQRRTRALRRASRPTRRACAPSRALPGVIRSVSAQRRRRACAPATCSRRSRATRACRPTRSPRRSAARSPRGTPRPASRPTSEPLFVIADFSAGWAELDVFPRDCARCARVSAVRDRRAARRTASGSDRLPAHRSATAHSQTRARARVVLDNADGRWRRAVRRGARRDRHRRPSPLAVTTRALQRFRDFTWCSPRSATPTRCACSSSAARDARMDGGARRARAGHATTSPRTAFLIKADIEKSGASHDH